MGKVKQVTSVKVENKCQYAKVTLDTGYTIFVPNDHPLATVGTTV